jgi:hypothetical protein
MLRLSYYSPSRSRLPVPLVFLFRATVVGAVHFGASLVVGVMMMNYTDVLPNTPVVQEPLRSIDKMLSLPATAFIALDQFDHEGWPLFFNAGLVGCLGACAWSFVPSKRFTRG